MLLKQDHCSFAKNTVLYSINSQKYKDKTLLEILRPNSLPNIGHNILTKSIAKRLEKAAQTRPAGRFIGENVRLIHVLYEARRHTRHSYFLDFRKAFDTLQLGYLKIALERFNFSPDVIN